jgi:membrane-bound metal-dependent hydrolase YbcI (DUF457 family)
VGEVLGHTHALSGLVAGVAAAQLVLHDSPGRTVVVATVAAGAAVLPDIDHPHANAALCFGFVTEAFAWLVAHVSGGHRHGTHSFFGIAAFTVAAFEAERYLYTPAGKVGLGLLLVLVLASGLRALRIAGHSGDLIAIAGAAAIMYSGYGLASVPIAIAVGTAAHLAGDALTDEGIPIAWPLSRKHVRLLPEPFAFTTGTRPERWVVAPLLVVTLGWLLTLAVTALPGSHFVAR